MGSSTYQAPWRLTQASFSANARGSKSWAFDTLVSVTPWGSWTFGTRGCTHELALGTGSKKMMVLNISVSTVVPGTVGDIPALEGWAAARSGHAVWYLPLGLDCSKRKGIGPLLVGVRMWSPW